MSKNDAELPDEELIQENYRKNPFPFWLWAAVIVAMTGVMFWTSRSYTSLVTEEILETPFLSVTNREMSLFLWHNPEFMRVHVSNKQGYLPDFQYLGNVTVEPELAGRLVQATPRILFLYHTWDRLLKGEIPSQRVPEGLLVQFLEEAQEWRPQYWPEAPAEYVELYGRLDPESDHDVRERLPQDLKIAFWGWRQYRFEGEAVNAFHPTYGEIREFLRRHPHFRRHYWVNILGDSYLKSLDEDRQDSERPPREEVPAFLRAAILNDINTDI